MDQATRTTQPATTVTALQLQGSCTCALLLVVEGRGEGPNRDQGTAMPSSISPRHGSPPSPSQHQQEYLNQASKPRGLWSSLLSLWLACQTSLAMQPRFSRSGAWGHVIL